jgi:YVTN family beta-propeller protein
VIPLKIAARQKYLETATIAVALATITAGIPLQAKRRGDDDALSQNLPNLGQQITPLAPRGAQFQPLNPNLKDHPEWLAEQAVTSVVSPDRKTLLVLTSGYNLVNDANGSRNKPDSTEYVFVYDISKSRPVQKQVIQVPNTYNGIVFDPSGTAFYVPGGVNDNVHIYALNGSGVWSEDPSSPIKLNHGKAAGSGSPEAAGIDITKDGKKLVVADYYNDSISILTKETSGWSKTDELDLRPGKIDPSKSGTPGGEYPFWVSVKGNDTAYISSIRDREIVVVNIAGTPTVTDRIHLKGQPNKMTLNAAQNTLYVAEDQTDSVAVIDTASNQVIRDIPVTAPEGLMPKSRRGYTGSNTNSVTLSPDERMLYVSNGNMNNIAAIDLRALFGVNPVIGLIPTGWYPNSVSFSGNGKFMYVLNGKSPTGPNAEHCKGGIISTLPAGACAGSNEYSLQMIKAGFQSFPIPKPAELATLTLQVAQNNHFERKVKPRDEAMMSFLNRKIKHVIYIIKENRTYDQILGDLEVGNGDPNLTEFGSQVTPNLHNIARNFVDLDNFYDASEVSMDGWPWSVSARAPDVVERQTPVNYAGRGLSNDSEGSNRGINVGYATLAERLAANPNTPNDPDLLPGQTDTAAPDGPGNQVNTGYLWDQALRAGLTVRNYGFFVQNVGPTMAEPYLTNTVVVSPTSASLRPYTDLYYRGFDMSMDDFYLYREWARDFDARYAQGGLPALSLVRLPHDHTGNYSTALAGVNTPELEEADNDYAVGLLIEKVAKSRYADDTLIFVIEDDAQDGGDHVDVHRSTAYIVGPYVRQHAVVSTSYNTVSFVRTIEEILGLDPLNLNDSLALPMADVFDRSQKNWTFKAMPSPLLYNTQLPLPPQTAGLRIPKPTHDAAYWAAATKGLDFSSEDRVNGAEYNRILWKGLMGNKPYPSSPTGTNLSNNRSELLGRYEHKIATSELKPINQGGGQ